MLTENQKKAALMLYEGDMVQDVAKAVGVHRCTIWRWTKRSDFRKERRRIAHNRSRKFQRMNMKIDEEREKYWEQREQECRENLQKEGEKIKDKPGSSFYRAMNEYEKAMLRGYSLSQILDLMTSDKPLRHKRRKG